MKYVKYSLGDLFAIFPDLPWNRTAMTTRSRALRSVPFGESVRATRAAVETARRRVQIQLRRRRR